MNESCQKYSCNFTAIAIGEEPAEAVDVRNKCIKTIGSDDGHSQSLSDKTSRAVNNELYENCKNIIFSVLNRNFFWCYEHIKEELIQEGAIALIIANEKFNENMNSEFSNYAYRTIKTSMKRYIDNHSTTVREFVHVRGERYKMDELFKKYNRPLSINEVESEFGVLKRAAMRIVNDYEHKNVYLSFDETFEQDNDKTLYDYYEDETYMPDKQILKTGSIKAQLFACKKVICDTFPKAKEKYWNIFLKVVGLNEKGECKDNITYKEIGKKYGVTKQRIEQIYKMISTKLKEELDIDFQTKIVA